MNTNEMNMDGAGMLVARRASSASLAFGLLLAVLGVFAAMAPLFTGITVTVIVGMLLFVGGVVQGVHAFQSDSFGKGALRFAMGALSVVAAVILLMAPGAGLGVLTLMLAGFFLASGVMDIVVSFKVPAGEGKGWMLFNGLVAIALAVLIMAKWPVSGIWAVGILVGVRLMIYGMTLMALGNAGRHALTQLQDTRIAVLERHVRSGAEALHQAQAGLADQSAMLLALDNEVRKKVSSSEVDPAIVELNKDLGKARERMKEAAAAAKENWSKTQDEADAAFKKLQDSTSAISKRLKMELGLEKTDPAPGEAGE